MHETWCPPSKIKRELGKLERGSLCHEYQACEQTRYSVIPNPLLAYKTILKDIVHAIKLIGHL